MLHEGLLLILSLLFAVSMLSILSEKLGISYPIFLVIAGLCISFIPGIPVVTLQPDIVFLIFLPPLLYAAAWNTSWKEFWTNRRPISMLAFGLVVFTSAAVALVSHAMIPGFPLAMGFLLGGVVSPPDAVAATSVLQGLKIPKKVVTILEGESLINDASSLIVFRFALAAVLTGTFDMWTATGSFFVVAGMGTIVGLVIANLVYVVHRFMPTTASIDTALTIITPYLMYIVAEHFHFSGVMAVVAGGLFLSFRSHELFSYNSRIQIYSVWETITFLLNGLVFILIGLQLPVIINGLGEYAIGESIFYSLVITILVILIRVAWVFPGAYLPRFLSKKVRTKEPRPTWKGVFLVAWSGMRGVVSLASALAVPLTLADEKTAFPHRNLVLFITFVVILFTLVLQGLTLPWVIGKLNIDEPEEDDESHKVAVRLKLAEVALGHMLDKYANELGEVDAYNRLKERYERIIDIANQRLSEDTEHVAPIFLPRYREMLLDLVTVRRKELQNLRKTRQYPDELIRSKEWELDLEEARLNEQN